MQFELLDGLSFDQIDQFLIWLTDRQVEAQVTVDDDRMIVSESRGVVNFSVRMGSDGSDSPDGGLLVFGTRGSWSMSVERRRIQEATLEFDAAGSAWLQVTWASGHALSVVFDADLQSEAD